MNAKLQCFEVERAISGEDDFAVDHGTRRQLRSKRPQQFGEVPVQRFFITALDKDLVCRLLLEKKNCVLIQASRESHPVNWVRSMLENIGLQKDTEPHQRQLTECP